MSTAPNIVPEVPGLIRLAWLLFMQPVQLRNAIMRWGLDPKASIWQLQKATRAGNQYASLLLRRLIFLLVIGTPIVATSIAAILALSGASVRWDGVAMGVAFGVVIGMSASVTSSLFPSFLRGRRAVRIGITIEIAFGIAVGVAFGVAFALDAGFLDNIRFSLSSGELRAGVSSGVAYSAAFGAAFGVLLSLHDAGTVDNRADAVFLGVFSGVLIGTMIGVLIGFAAGISHGTRLGVVGGVASGVAYLRLPLWFAEGGLSLLLSVAMRAPSARTLGLSRWLPPLHDDRIMVPLPGLHSCLLTVFEADEAQGKSLLAHAAVSPGLRTTSKSVLLELQARALERAAREARFQSVIDLDLPYPPDPRDPSAAVFIPFQSAGRDLLAGGRNQRQRRQALDRAYSVIQSFMLSSATSVLLDKHERRLLETCRVWLSVIEQQLQELEAEPAEVPSVFVAGTALKPSRPDERSLFKGREDVVRLIEHDLAPTRRGVIFVFGQRRMGKSSLCNWLPRLLGTGTTIVACDFQTLSGDEHRSHPHLRIIEGIGKAVPGLPEPPQQSSSWRDALAWLQTIDPVLAERRILVTIDEVERVEDGIRDGWCTTDFLDFLRATGDAVTNIRVVLLSAFPLRRLGRHWVDRLISVTPLSISYLSTAHASELLQHPVPDFPPIYPEGGVDHIVAKTHGHPYLLQRVGDELVRRINLRGAHQATDDDVTAALDTVVNEGDVPFLEIWDTRTEAERAVLLHLAIAGSSGDPASLDRDATTELVRDGYLERQGERVTIAVPLFRDWIRLFKL